MGDERHSIRRGADPELPELERITLASAAGVEAAFLPGSGMLGQARSIASGSRTQTRPNAFTARGSRVRPAPRKV